VAGSGHAAELPRPPPVYKAPPPAPIFTWTGFYLGGNFGGVWSHDTVTDEFGLSFATGRSGGVLFGGGQAGFNYQFGGGFVLGVEAELDEAANLDGAANNHDNVGNFPPAVGDTVVVASDTRWIATLAARFGWAFGNWLLYGKAGGGWAHNDGFTVTDLATGGQIGFGSFTASGWLLGAGAEWAIWNNWTIKLEYDFLGLNNRSFVIPAGAPLPPAFIGDSFTGHSNVQAVKVGFNYLFNWVGPVPGY
jgi:outer membrane immunogenic protein